MPLLSFGKEHSPQALAYLTENGDNDDSSLVFHEMCDEDDDSLFAFSMSAASSCGRSVLSFQGAAKTKTYKSPICKLPPPPKHHVEQQTSIELPQLSYFPAVNKLVSSLRCVDPARAPLEADTPPTSAIANNWKPAGILKNHISQDHPIDSITKDTESVNTGTGTARTVSMRSFGESEEEARTIGESSLDGSMRQEVDVDEFMGESRKKRVSWKEQEEAIVKPKRVSWRADVVEEMEEDESSSSSSSDDDSDGSMDAASVLKAFMDRLREERAKQLPTISEKKVATAPRVSDTHLEAPKVTDAKDKRKGEEHGDTTKPKKHIVVKWFWKLLSCSRKHVDDDEEDATSSATYSSSGSGERDVFGISLWMRMMSRWCSRKDRDDMDSCSDEEEEASSQHKAKLRYYQERNSNASSHQHNAHSNNKNEEEVYEVLSRRELARDFKSWVKPKGTLIAC